MKNSKPSKAAISKAGAEVGEGKGGVTVGRVVAEGKGVLIGWDGVEDKGKASLASCGPAVGDEEQPATAKAVISKVHKVRVIFLGNAFICLALG